MGQVDLANSLCFSGLHSIWVSRGGTEDNGIGLINTSLILILSSWCNFSGLSSSRLKLQSQHFRWQCCSWRGNHRLRCDQPVECSVQYSLCHSWVKLSSTMIVSSHSIRLIPVIWPVLVCITIITPYIIAVSLGHVYPFLPSISKAASFEPQASLFGALMTLVAFLGLAMMVARYVQVQAVPGDLGCEFSSKIIRLNKVGLRFGISCLIGVVLVASVRSSAKVVGIMADKTARIRTLG